MRFADQPYLWLLVLMPGLTALYVAASILRRRALERFGETGMLARLTASVSPPMRRLKAAFVVAGCGFLVLALARPQYGSKLEMVQRMGVDVIIAIDASASMLAEDVPPNRLQFAKHEMSGLIRRLRGDRVGIIAFAGDAFVQCPLTLDYGAAEMFIGEIEVGTVPRPGTDLGRAIEVAADAFGAGSRKSKVLVLLTDGEDLEAGAVEAAERAARAGVRIHTVGIGSGEGVPIPVRDESGQLREYKKDRGGEMVMSRLDEATLRRVARAALGSYYRATFDASELDALYREMAAMEQSEQGALEYTSFEDRFQWVLAVALALLVAEAVLSDRRREEPGRRGVGGRWRAHGWWGVRGWRRVRGPSLLLLILAALVAWTPGWADPERKMRRGNSLYDREKYDEAIQAYREAQLEAPESKELWYNVGNALYRKGAFEEAVGEYEGAAGAPGGKVREWSTYNTGNALYRGQHYQEAIEAYKQALRLDPTDRDAKFNLELAQDRLQEMQQQEQQQQQQQGEGQEQQQKQESEPQKGEEQKREQQQQEQQQSEEQQGQQEREGEEQQPEERQGEEQPPPQPREGELSEQEVERLLDALQEQESEVREEMREAQAVGQVGVDRDW